MTFIRRMRCPITVHKMAVCSSVFQALWDSLWQAGLCPNLGYSTK